MWHLKQSRNEDMQFSNTLSVKLYLRDGRTDGQTDAGNRIEFDASVTSGGNRPNFNEFPDN